MTGQQLVLATHNTHKVEEFKSLLGNLGIEILTLDRFPAVGAIVEDADTLEGNARKKAGEVFRLVNLPVLADDSGLEVYFLNGEPGVYSSRYAGEKATYRDNCNKLLLKLRGVAPRRRSARFRCVLHFIGSRKMQHTVEGVCKGVIAEKPRGSNGFGYDPIFVPGGFSKTLAELTAVEKNRLSHRGMAVESIVPVLAHHFQSQ